MTAIFDMDGTLIDSSKILSNSVNYVRNSLGLPPLESDFIIQSLNNPKLNLAKVLYKQDEITPELYAKFRSYYDKNHQKELVLFDGIKELLEELKQNNIKLAVATNAYKATTLATLEHINIKDFFDEVVSFEDVKNPKPHPDMLEYITTKLSSQKPIFIGDSANDYLAAKEAKIPFVYVDFINKKDGIKSVSELAKTLKSFFRV
jgi:phosphoglycolate phosphatase